MEQRSNRYEVIPVIFDGAQSNIPIPTLAWVWEQIESRGYHVHAFYGGTIADVNQFISFMLHRKNFPVLVWDHEAEKFIHLAWLNDLSDGYAFGHHCSLDRYRRGAAKAVLRYWGRMKKPDGTPLFRLLLGLTPVTNTMAVRFLKLIGFKIVGEIPGICYLFYGNRYVGGILSHYQFEVDTWDQEKTAAVAAAAV